jgi:hypothetical protein
MKSVLISIQTKWCELIASGKKTVEVRKTRPKLETPFKVYIYETMKPLKDFIFDYKNLTETQKTIINGRGKVIGEFVCDEIFPIKVFENGSIQDYVCHGMEHSCVRARRFFCDSGIRGRWVFARVFLERQDIGCVFPGGGSPYVRIYRCRC